MRTREDAIAYCLSFPEAYEDYPFRDTNWCLIRHRKNRKVFAWIFEKDGLIWINVKCDPNWRDFWRSAYSSVRPAYHLNKDHWNSILLDGTVPKEDIAKMVAESYTLTKGTKTHRKQRPEGAKA